MPPQLHRLLQIPTGVTSLIGSGGKSTMLSLLGQELSAGHRVILTTTTHFLADPAFPLVLCGPEGICVHEALHQSDSSQHTLPLSELAPDISMTPQPGLPAASLADALHYAFSLSSVITVAAPAAGSKLCCPSAISPDFAMEVLRSFCDYVLVEADGSRCLPLKAHAAHEPVIDPCSTRTICVVGASGFGRPVRQVVHRPEIFCALTSASPDTPVTPHLAAAAVNAEHLADMVFLNQLDAVSASGSNAGSRAFIQSGKSECTMLEEVFREFADTCSIPCTGGSLQHQEYIR